MEQTKKIDWDYYEAIIAYGILTDEAYLSSVIDHIKPSFFNDKNIGAVVTLICDYYKERSTVPTITEIKAYLTTPELKESFKQVVHKFDNIDQKLNRDELTENTEQFLKERGVYQTLLSVADECSSTDIDTSEILRKFEDACNVNLSTDMGLDYFDDIDRQIADLQTSEATVPSKWEWLDNKLGGGFLEKGKSIYIFAGETNIGKSIFLANIAVNICEQDKTVLLVSLEMPEMIYARRVSSDVTKIPMNELHMRTDELREQLNVYKQNNSNSKLLIKEFPPSTITCNHLKAFIKKIVDQGVKLDMIVIDYVNLLRSTYNGNSYERIKDNTEQLRALSYVFKCPIVTATQLNRSGYDEVNPGLDTISESIGLAATADAIFSLWQEEEDAELGIIKLGVMKNRFGPNFGSTSMRVDYNTLSLSEDDILTGDSDLNAATSTLSMFADDISG